MASLDCRRFRALHLAYLDAGVSDGVRADMEQHLLACDACAAHDTLVRRAMLVARNLRAMNPSREFRLRLTERLAACRAERVAARFAAIPDDAIPSDPMVDGAHPWHAGWDPIRQVISFAAGAMRRAPLSRG